MENVSVSLTDTQTTVGSFNPTAANGASASVTGGAWTTSDANVSLTPAPDGNSCNVVALSVGTFTINVSAVNDAGTTLTAIVNGTITASTTATALNISFSAPVQK